MRSPIVISSLWLPLVAALSLGCSVDPEVRLVGKWTGDSSAVGTAIKAAKMKADSPDVDGSTAMAAARALGAVSLDLNADKSCALFMGGNTLKGKWTLVKEENIVELNLESAEIPPENQAKNPEGFKPQQYIALVNESIDKLEVLPMARKNYHEAKEMLQGKKFPSLIVMRK